MTGLCVRCDIISSPRSLQGTNPYSHFSDEETQVQRHLPQIPLLGSGRSTGQSRTDHPFVIISSFSCEGWRCPRRAGRPSDTSICCLSPNSYVRMFLSLIFAWNLRGYFEIRCSACLFSHSFSIQNYPSRLMSSGVAKLKKTTNTKPIFYVDAFIFLRPHIRTTEYNLLELGIGLFWGFLVCKYQHFY